VTKRAESDGNGQKQRERGRRKRAETDRKDQKRAEKTKKNRTVRTVLVKD